MLYLVNFWCRLLAGFGGKEGSTVQAMARNRLPVFAHGQADNFVPWAMTQAAYDAADCEKELLLVPGSWSRPELSGGPGRYLQMLERFLNRNLPANAIPR